MQNRPIIPFASLLYQHSIAQHRSSAAVNSTMVITYWEIGELIYKACGENDRAEYGKKLLQYLSEQLTAEFGKGFSVQGLRNMRQFYCTFPNRSTVWSVRQLERQINTMYYQRILVKLWNYIDFLGGIAYTYYRQKIV